MLKDNLTILIVLLIIGGTGFYIYNQEREITRLQEMRIGDVKNEITILDDERKAQEEKNSADAKEIERLQAALKEANRQTRYYKGISDDLYSRWESERLDPNDTSLIAIIDMLRGYSSGVRPLTETSP